MSKPLLQRNTRLLLIWLPVVLLVCSLLFYEVLTLHAHHMQEKYLTLKQQNIWSAFVARPQNMERHVMGEYDITEKDGLSVGPVSRLKDTALLYAETGKKLPFRTLISLRQWNGRTYLIATYVSSTEISHLVIKVFATEAVILILLLLAIALLNLSSSRWLWKPFFSTMKEVEGFDITKNKAVHLPAQTGTREFDELNQVLTDFISKANAAYYSQKQFVENASHEMQTPLAIIRSKLELLINRPQLTEKSASLLEDITQANDRLSQMNRTLLLMAKIENSQFPQTEQVNISQIIQLTLENFQNHYDHFPELKFMMEENVIVSANRPLLEILVSNLINNAIVHNIPGGNIHIALQGMQLVIENTGPAPDSHPEELFERFKKGSPQAGTTGLGLSLVKQICLLYGYGIHYHYRSGWHVITVTLR